MLELGIISDEISDDFDRACTLVREWGMRHVELRTLWGKNVLQLDDDEIDRARGIVRSHDLTVTAIASPVFKSSLSGEPRVIEADFSLGGSERFEDQLELLERTLRLCERFDAPAARVFTFWREPWTADLAQAVAERLAIAAERADAAGRRLVVENEPVCTVGTGAQLGELDEALRRAAPHHLHAIALLWDPGNALAAGETRAFPDGYEALETTRIAHVHLKDAVVDSDARVTFVPLGQGGVDYWAHLRRLVDDGYAGTVVLEPHYRPEGMDAERAAHIAVEAAQALIAATLSDGVATDGGA